MSGKTCCNARPSEYPHTRAEDIPDVSRLLVDVSPPGALPRCFRCRDCGQAWEEHRTAKDGVASYRVVKIGWAAAPPPPAGPAPVPRGTARPPAPPPPRGWRSAGLLALAALVFYAVWSLPPVAAAAAPYGWVARWIVGGVLAALAVQTFLSILRAKRPAGRG
jgi:hypothetical protein